MAAVAVPDRQQEVHRDEQRAPHLVLADVVLLVRQEVPVTGRAETITNPTVMATR